MKSGVCRKFLASQAWALDGWLNHLNSMERNVKASNTRIASATGFAGFEV